MVEKITVLPALLFLMTFTVSYPVLVLDGFDCVSKLGLVLSSQVNGRHNVVVLGRGIGEGVSNDSPNEKLNKL